MPTPEDNARYMQARRDKGLLPVHFFVPASLKAAWQAFADGQGRRLKEEIVLAMARHMASPPPRPSEAPLPPAPLPQPVQEAAPPQPKRKPGRPKKNS
jgi:hypothetical protein